MTSATPSPVVATGRILVLGLAAMLLLGVASCGKKGSPESPGPGDRITYPRTYPTQ
jgi:predicted small lipoprotein YifL